MCANCPRGEKAARIDLARFWPGEDLIWERHETSFTSRTYAGAAHSASGVPWLSRILINSYLNEIMQQSKAEESGSERIGSERDRSGSLD